MCDLCRVDTLSVSARIIEALIGNRLTPRFVARGALAFVNIYLHAAGLSHEERIAWLTDGANWYEKTFRNNPPPRMGGIDPNGEEAVRMAWDESMEGAEHAPN